MRVVCNYHCRRPTIGVYPTIRKVGRCKEVGGKVSQTRPEIGGKSNQARNTACFDVIAELHLFSLDILFDPCLLDHYECGLYKVVQTLYSLAHRIINMIFMLYSSDHVIIVIIVNVIYRPRHSLLLGERNLAGNTVVILGVLSIFFLIVKNGTFTISGTIVVILGFLTR